MEFSFFESLLFLFLLIAAASVFGFLSYRPLTIIKQGKPDSERLDNLGDRFKTLFSEVILQKRVTDVRPVVGYLHATVFFAFIIFSLETLNMFLEPFGLGFLHIMFGSFLPVFRTVVMLIAILCTISMIALAYRRFVMVSISPNPKSYESGFVAFLIIILMLTYVDMFGTKILSQKFNWWLHAVVILGFPAIILNSKHRHIFLAPVAVFLRKPKLWDVEKMDLNFDEAENEDDIQLGLETLSDIPWKLRLDFFSCVECKRCTDSCPASQAGQELRPSEFIIEGREALLTGDESAPVIGSVISEKALSQCTSCMACEHVCPVGVEHSQLLAGAKAMQTLAVGTGPATEFLKIMTNYSNPFSAGPDIKSSIVQETGIPAYEKGKTEYLLWLGCVWAYNPDYKAVVKATVDVLNKAGVSYGILPEEMCCGHHSRKQGEEMQFQMLADENAELLKTNEVTKIVTGCPHCLNSIRHDYTDYLNGQKIELLHHSELLNDLIKSGKIKLNESQDTTGKVTYHDPCYLGRYEGVTAEPRSILASAQCKIVETENNGVHSYCCGGGAAGFTMESKDEKRVDQMRKEQITASGASMLITSCPECNMMLKGTLETTKDISEFICDSLD